MVRNGLYPLFEDLGLFSAFFIRKSAGVLRFFLKESALHEMGKARYHHKNSEKGCERYNGVVWKGQKQ